MFIVARVTRGSHVFMRNESVRYLRFFKEMAKSAYARLLLASLGDSKKLVSPVAEWWVTPYPRKFEDGSPVGHDTQGLLPQ